MKTLELELNKRLLIVEAPEGELTAIGNDKEVHYAIKKYGKESYIKIANGKTHKLICKGSELTDGKIRHYLHESIYSGLFAHYVKDIPVNTYCYNSALESFISAIEAKGYYWKDVPWDFPLVEDYGYQTSSSPEVERGWMYEGGEEKYHEVLKAYEEAESRTFNPEKTIIFEIIT